MNNLICDSDVEHIKTYTFNAPTSINANALFSGKPTLSENSVFFDLSFLRSECVYLLSSSRGFVFMTKFEAGTQEEAMEIAKQIILDNSIHIAKRILLDQ